MISQPLKDVYFLFGRWLTLPSYYLARVRFRRPSEPEGFYLHLGSGTRYIPGMINVDGNLLRRKDLWLDLRTGLPFPDASVAFAYCCHVLEHLYPSETLRLLREMRRVLSAEGTARVAVPSMERALEIAASQARSAWPREFDDPLGQAANYLFCDGQHKYAYSFGSLAQFARLAGFTRVSNYSASQGVTPKRYGQVKVGDEPDGSLVVELQP